MQITSKPYTTDFSLTAANKPQSSSQVLYVQVLYVQVLWPYNSLDKILVKFNPKMLR